MCKENLNLFNNFSPPPHPGAIFKRITIHACGAADVEPACAAPCLRADESMRISHCDALQNGAGVTWMRRIVE